MWNVCGSQLCYVATKRMVWRLQQIGVYVLISKQLYDTTRFKVGLRAGKGIKLSIFFG